MEKPLWIPSEARVAEAAMTEFRRLAQERAGRELPDFDALHAWSVADTAAFWGRYADYAGVRFDAPPQRIRSDDPMPATRWFEGATLNYARELLYPRRVDRAHPPEVICVTETGDRTRLDLPSLRRLVRRVQDGLRAAGVGRGDAVAAYAANVPETLAVLLACAGVGAVFSSCSPDFGAEAAGARFAQLEPKVLFASPLYRYGGRAFDTGETVGALAATLPDLQALVALPYPGVGVPASAPGTAWDDWLGPESAAAEPELAMLPFDHPLYVLYSSGTTGRPKAMVHRAGGALLTHHKEHRLHSDIRPGDVVFYFTTCGWMMWNWLVSALAQGASVVLYDGSPAHPDLGALWRLAADLGVTLFGTSARFIHTLQAHGFRPGEHADLSRLRAVASTGSPLSPSGFHYVYEDVKADLHLASISGGTDIVSCFMLGVPTLPVYAGQIQRPGLGVDLAVFDDSGNELVGEPGELVCRQALPSMPLAFLDDPERRRYREAYFSVYPGVWRHGDRVERTAEGGIVVYGRSDATLNPGGVRIGTAEVYRPLERVPEVVEAAAVGRRTGGRDGSGDEEIWLLVVLAEGRTLDEELVGRIKGAIREGASPRHVPRRVLQVPQLPRTRSGKSMEMAVSRLVNGLDVPNAAVVANPEALEAVRAAVEGEPTDD